MSSIKTEIQYPKNLNTYRIEAIHGKIDISRISDHQEQGKEHYLLKLDGIQNHQDEGKKLKIEIRGDLMEEIVGKILELFEVSPESKFTTSDGKTYYFHEAKTKSIEF